MRMAMLRRIDHEARRRTTRPELPERLWTPPLTRHAQTPLIQTRVVTRHRFHGDWNYTLRPHHEQGRRSSSRTPTASWPPSCTCADSVHRPSWPNCSTWTEKRRSRHECGSSWADVGSFVG